MKIKQTEQVPATEIKASDIVMFDPYEYKVRSVIVRSDRVELVFWHTNAELPYSYERDFTMTRVVQ